MACVLGQTKLMLLLTAIILHALIVAPHSDLIKFKTVKQPCPLSDDAVRDDDLSEFPSGFYICQTFDAATNSHTPCPCS